MATTIKSLLVKIEGDTKNIQAQLDNMNKHLTASSKKVDKASSSFAGMWKQMFAGQAAFAIVRSGFRMIIEGFKESISLGSEAAETESKFGVIFADVMNQASSAVTNLTDNYGQSTLAAQTMLSATGDLLTGLGMNSKVALDLSSKTQQLAVDLASFTNYSGGARGASDALTKAMLGEREMIKSLGIVITEEMVKEQLLATGKSKLTGLALKQAKAEATLQLAIMQSKNAIGDYARTQDSWANQLRELENTIEEIKVEIGKAFIEVALPALQDFGKWVKENKETIIAVFEAMIMTIKDLASWALKTIDFLAQLFDPGGIKATEDVMTSLLMKVRLSTEEMLKMKDAASGSDGKGGAAGGIGNIKLEMEKLDPIMTGVNDTLGQFQLETGEAIEGMTKAEVSTLKWEEKIIKLRQEQEKAENSTKSFKEEIIELTQNVNTIGQSLLNLGESLGLGTGKFSGALSNLTSGISSLASGDIVGAIASGINLVGDLIGLFEGKDPVEEALEDWNELIEEGKIGTREMWELMQEVNAEGLEVAEIQDHIADSINAGVEALSFYYDYAATSQDRFNRAQLYTVALFSGLLAQGLSFVDAIREMQDEFQKLKDIVETQGYAINESLAFMLDVSDFIEQHETLANAVNSVGDILDAVFTSGIYSINQMQDVLAVAGQDLVDMFNQIVNQSGNQQTAFALIVPELEKLIYYANQYGFAIDEATQGLINQAQEAGYLSEIQVPPMEKIAEILEVMLDMWSQFLGITYELSWAVDQVTDSVNQLGQSAENVEFGGGEFSPVIGAQKGFSGLLEKDILFKAHKGELLNIIPKEKVSNVYNKRGDVNYNWTFPMTDGGKMSDFELENRMIELIRRRGRLIDIMNKELD